MKVVNVLDVAKNYAFFSRKTRWNFRAVRHSADVALQRKRRGRISCVNIKEKQVVIQISCYTHLGK